MPADSFKPLRVWVSMGLTRNRISEYLHYESASEEVDDDGERPVFVDSGGNIDVQELNQSSESKSVSHIISA